MPAPKSIPIIGIAGGIASGKSLVTEQLKQRGALVISADAAAHAVLNSEEVKRLVRDRWHDAVFSADGQIDRPALGRIVFGSPPVGPRERAYLEQITHPRIGAMIRQQLQQAIDEGTAPAIVLDVPLLFESGWNEICNTIVFVDTPRPLRELRAGLRGWTAEEFAQREGAERPAEAKRQLADIVIDNSTTPESAEGQVESFWNRLFGSEEKAP